MENMTKWIFICLLLFFVAVGYDMSTDAPEIVHSDSTTTAIDTTLSQPEQEL